MYSLYLIVYSFDHLYQISKVVEDFKLDSFVKWDFFYIEIKIASLFDLNWVS